MRKIGLVLFSVFVAYSIFLSCSKPSSPPDPSTNPQPGTNGNVPDTTKKDTTRIDSIMTWSHYVLAYSCNVFSDPSARSLQRYKFYYDTAGLLTKMTIYGSLHSEPYTYNFKYDVNKKLYNIVCRSCCDPLVYDSLTWHNVSANKFEVWNYSLRFSGYTTLAIYEQRDYRDSIAIKVTGAQAGATFEPWFRCLLQKDTAGDITSVAYFRIPPFNVNDTAMTLQSTFHKNLTNPWYDLYKRVGFAFFFFLDYGDMYGNVPVYDMTQVFSKHCMAKCTIKSFNNTLCGPAGSSSVTRQYDLNDYYTYRGSQVSRLRDANYIYWQKGYSGFINGNAEFYFNH
jgi:hypothetical protein